jgi:plasmid replication initiation protein
MKNELFTEKKPETTLPEVINTPETLGVMPRYVLQYNAISRGAHNLSATAQKLAAMAMALLPSDLSSLTASFTFTDFCKAIGFGDGGGQYKIFRAAVNECLQSLISIETEPDKKGKKKWKAFTWFTVAEFDEVTGQARMTFSSELAEFLAAIKWMYAKVNLKDLGKLQSRYAIHLFEIAMSYRSLAGKNGNRGETWYFERSFPDEIRQIMGVAEDAYKDNYELKRYIIDGPIKEINEAEIGVKITPLSIKEGRRVTKLRINCKSAPRTQKQSEEAVLEPDDGEKPEEEDLEYLRELYPDEYDERLQDALDSRPDFFKRGNLGIYFAEQRVLMELKEKYGIAKRPETT